LLHILHTAAILVTNLWPGSVCAVNIVCVCPVADVSVVLCKFHRQQAWNRRLANHTYKQEILKMYVVNQQRLYIYITLHQMCTFLIIILLFSCYSISFLHYKLYLGKSFAFGSCLQLLLCPVPVGEFLLQLAST